MSINNFVPQFASDPITGQLFMLTPPNQPIIFHNRFNSQFPLQQQTQQQQQQRPSLRTSYVHQLPGLQQPTFALAHTIRSFSTAQSNETPPIDQRQTASKTVHKTNLEIKKIKEKCITHYIDGQIIVETAKPLPEKKIKTYKTKPIRSQEKLQTEQKEQISHKPRNHQYQIRLKSMQQEKQAHLNESIYQRKDQQIAPNYIQPKFAQTVRSQQTNSEQIQQIRTSMTNWSVADVVNFIERHEDIKQYSSKFAEDEVDGKALLLMIDRNLNFQTLTSMFKYGPAMKIEAALSKYKVSE